MNLVNGKTEVGSQRQSEAPLSHVNLLAGKTEAGSQCRSEAPHPPTKKWPSWPTEGGKVNKPMRRGGTVHSLQEKRLSGRQRKERNLIQPPRSYPPVAGLWKEAFQN